MRSQATIAFLVIPLATAVLVAQPARGTSADAPLMQAVSLDVGAVMEDRLFIALEPLVFGRVSLGLGASLSTQSNRGPVAYPLAISAPTTLFAPCLPEACPPTPAAQDRQRASSVGLRLRWYPKVPSFSGERRAIAGYVGESLDWQERSTTTYTYYPPPMASDTLLSAGAIDWPYGETYRRRIHGLETSFEFGARLMLSRRVLIDVGTSTRLVRLDDPDSRLRPGDTASRFTFAIGFGW